MSQKFWNCPQATEVPGKVRLIFDILLITRYSLFEVESEHKVCFKASLTPTGSFLVVKNLTGQAPMITDPPNSPYMFSKNSFLLN